MNKLGQVRYCKLKDMTPKTETNLPKIAIGDIIVTPQGVEIKIIKEEYNGYTCEYQKRKNITSQGNVQYSYKQLDYGITNYGRKHLKTNKN